ncbi:MAG: tRNA pseudouridine(38-40) synthase TruA, partial [Rickettsiales bacterium]|nr:tRNA pseudouridine(38-40) synthase TruA [Rickettsiales bacterium]
YKILNRPTRPAIDEGRVWWVFKKLDAGLMHRTAQNLIGSHDFSTFRASQCQAASPVKTLDSMTVARRGEFVIVRAAARSFLHRQVRNMVGSLKLVGEGKWTEADFIAAFKACDRTKGGPAAPAEGLYFEKAEY